MGTMAPPVYHVILNATAGSGRANGDRRALEEAFAAHGLDGRIHAVGVGGDIVATAKRILAEGAEVIVAAGGDGTVSAVASCVRGSRATLGVLPMGTLNHFARDLGIPPKLEDAVAVLAGGLRVGVDLGEVNGRVFVNNASLGLYPDMVRDRERQQRRLGRGKWWAMLWAGLATLHRSPFLRLTLEIEGREAVHCRSPFVFVGNNEYVMEGFDIGARESLRCGRLSIYTTTRCTRLGLVALALRALLGCLRQAEDFSTAAACHLRIDSPRRRLLVATDGEVTAMETPLEFRVLRAALPVLAPAR